MPQHDRGSEQHNDSSVSLDGAPSPNGTTSALFGASSHARRANNGSFPPGNGPIESARKNSAAKPTLETAITGITRQENRGVANSSTMEYFRRIYLSLQPPNTLDAMPTIGVTSALDGEGKSTVALGIA